MRDLAPRLAALLFVAALAACGGEPLRVTSIQVGRALNADGTVAKHTTVFAPNDTVYVSVLTSGVGTATIGVRWTYAGRVMGEPKKEVSYKDVAATEFHLQSVAGFPEGDYSVDIFLNGQSVGTRTFKVEKQG